MSGVATPKIVHVDRVAFAGLFSFAVWTAVVIYVFAARSATRAWLWLGGLTLALGHVLRAQFAQAFAVKFHRSGRADMGAGKGLQKAGLADAIGAHDAGDFASAGGKINAVQDLAAAVMQGQALGFDHHPRPR